MEKEAVRLKIINQNNIGELLDVLNHVQDGDARKKEELRVLLEIKGISVDSKPRKDGRWQGRYTVDGKQKPVYGKSKEEVIFQLQQIVNGKTEKRVQKAEKTYTLHKWLEKWFELYKANLKPLSQQSIRDYINAIKRILPDKAINKFQSLEIEEALKKLSTDYQRKRTYSKLMEIFGKAENLGLIKRNPCKGVERPAYKQQKKRAFTLDEQTLICKNFETHKYGAVYYLMLTTGLRIGEVLSLTKLDITHNSVSVTKNVVYLNKERIVQSIPKTEAGIRTVPLPQAAYEQISALLQKGDDELFPTLTIATAEKAFSTLCKKLNLNGYTPHSLRHTYATRLAEASIPPKVRQYLMGHANLEVTENTYTDTQKSYVDSQSSAVLSVFDTKK